MTTQERDHEKKRLTPPSWRALRFAVAIVLLSAATAKAFELASGAALVGSALQSPFLELGLVVFEASFAVWALFGLFPNLNRVATILLFSVFSLVTLTKGLKGEVSCGCFGAATVNPWVTFALDVAIVGFGLATYRREKTIASSRTRGRIVAQLATTVVAVAALGAISYGGERNVVLTSADQAIPVGARVALLPETWLNAELPLTPFCQVDVDLSAGRYAVMLRRAGCEECRARLLHYQTRAEELNVKLVLLDVEETSSGEVVEGACLGRLDPRYSWFVQTPVLILIDDSIVVRVER